MAQIILSAAAARDLKDVSSYISKQTGKPQAHAVLKKIATAIQTIGAHPFIGRSRNELRKGIRSYAISPYVTLYRVIDEEVKIVRVLHSSRNLSSINLDDDL